MYVFRRFVKVENKCDNVTLIVISDEQDFQFNIKFIVMWKCISTLKFTVRCKHFPRWNGIGDQSLNHRGGVRWFYGMFAFHFAQMLRERYKLI